MSDKTNTTVALNHETASLIATPPEGVDRPLWLYEICRLLVIEVNALVIAFFSETPACSAATCPEMRASEWQYLCAVHDPPKSCCAIDYCCHTLDWASNVLTSQKNFPSRLTLGSETTGGSPQGMRHLTNIFRRVYRIFAHAWFQHRASFWEVEGRKGLYIFFKTVCDAYTLIPDENYTISPEAEGIVTAPEKEKESRAILKKTDEEEVRAEDLDPKPVTIVSAGATTRRHKHTPSTGSLVTTIAESDEDDSSAPSFPNEKDVPVEKFEFPASSAPPNPPPPPPPPRTSSTAAGTNITAGAASATATIETFEEPTKEQNHNGKEPLRPESNLPDITGPGVSPTVTIPAEQSLPEEEAKANESSAQGSESKQEKAAEENVKKEEIPETENPKIPTKKTQLEPTEGLKAQ